MSSRHAAFGFWLLAANGAASACGLPALVAIPAAGALGDGSAQVVAATQLYISAIKEYAACVQGELAAAGGATAPASLRNQLIARNNHAVAEAEAVLALFGERVTLPRNLYLAEFVAGESKQCIATPRLESTSVVNDLAVLFIERDGRTHLNVLEQACPDLERFGQFQVRRNLLGASDAALGPVQTNRLCSNEFIMPYAFDTDPLRSRECALGRFFEVTEEQAARLTALRAGARAAAPAASSGAAAEETRVPPRSEP